MSLSGPDALKSLEEALRDIRREENEIARRLSRSVELMTKLGVQEAELYRQLGALRLGTAPRDELAAAIAAMDDRIASAIALYDAALAEADARLEALDTALAENGSARAALQADAGKRAKELQTLAAKARPRLGTHPGYADKLAAMREFSNIAELSLSKTAQAEADRDLKARAYRDDPLFMYLWEKGYGTRSDKSNALVARADGWIAELIGYTRARASFALINDLPLRLRDHAVQAQERAMAAAAELARIESVAVDTAGGKAAREALDDLAGQIAAIDRDCLALQDRRDEAARAQRELAQGNEPAFAAARDELTKLLEREDLRGLLASVRATPKGQDLTVVQQIDDLRQRVKDEGEEAREHRLRLSILAARRRGLEDIQHEIKTRGFDNPHSSFSDTALVQTRLNDFLRGGLLAPAYWERWRLSQDWSEASYGGPGGGWGRLPAPAQSSGLSRPRGSRGESLTSAA